MNDQDQQPVSADQLRRLEAQVSLLVGRVEYLEERLGIQERPSTPDAPPTHLSAPATQPVQTVAPSTPVGPLPVPDVLSAPVGVQPTPQAPAGGTAVPATPAPPHVPLLPEVPPMEDATSQQTEQTEPVAAPSMASYTEVLQKLQTAPSIPAESQTTGVAQNDTATPATHRRQPHQETNDWERLIGGKWALWVGSLAVFLALAFFLAYTWGSLSPAGRLAIGFVAGTMFVAAGGYARGRLDNWFSEGLTGAGLGIFYLSTWTGAQSYQMLSFEVAFTLMAITTIAGVGLAVYYDAVSLTALSTLGGFLTPVLLHSSGGAGSALPFMTYVSLLNIGILLVSLFKRWNGIVWLSFIATFLLVSGWALSSYSEALRWPSFLFVTLLFQVFVGAACFYSLIRKEETAKQDLLLLFANSFVYAVAGYAILGDVLGDYPGALAFALALAFAGLGYAIREVVPQNAPLQRAAVGLALFFLTITIPIQLDQDWVAIGWSVQAAALLTLGIRLHSRLLRRAGEIVWALSLLPLLPIVMGEHRFSTPFTQLLLNERALPLLISALATGWMAAVANPKREAEDEPSTLPAHPADAWVQRSGWAEVFALWAVGSGAWLIAQETHMRISWSHGPSGSTWPLGSTWWTGTLFVITILWCGYSLAIFGLGRFLHHMTFRLGAFLVAALATVLPLWASLALPASEWTPFWNLRSLSYLVVGLTLAALGWMAAREKEEALSREDEALGVLPVVIGLLVLWGMTLEVYFSFEKWQIPSPETWLAGAGFVIAVLWSAFALAMLLLGFAWSQTRLRWCAYAVGMIGILVLLGTALGSTALNWAPLANARFMAFTLTTALLVVATTAMYKRKEELGGAESDFPATMTLLALGILLWGLTQETYETCRYFQASLGADWTRTAQLAISLVWTLCGALLLIGGIVRSYQPVRLAALGLLGLTVLKVFLFDLSSLDTPLRILSFGGLGLALIFISWLYSRFGVARDTTASETKTQPGEQGAG